MPLLAIIIIFTASIIANRQKRENTKEVQTIQENILQNTEETNKKAQENTEKETEEAKITNENWKIEIPEISLIGTISEGTDEETLNQYIGHFESTPKKEGNVGLAAHNRGYPINYFANLKYLKGGEEIKYTYGEFTKTYIVIKNIKISDIDWSYLENTEENQITLITCIENEPAYRRCIQAVEKEENN